MFDFRILNHLLSFLFHKYTHTHTRRIDAIESVKRKLMQLLFYSIQQLHLLRPKATRFIAGWNTFRVYMWSDSVSVISSSNCVSNLVDVHFVLCNPSTNSWERNKTWPIHKHSIRKNLSSFICVIFIYRKWQLTFSTSFPEKFDHIHR